MPLDDTLPPSRLRPSAERDEIVRHFVRAFGVNVGTDDLDSLPRPVRLRLSGVRPPEPTEAIALDRVLQVVPPAALRPIQRILIIDGGITGHLGVYANGVIRLGTDALRLRQPDLQFAGRLSIFSATVLHEIGHAAYQRLLSPAQRFAAEELYLNFQQARRDERAEASAEEAEHHFVALFVAVAAGIGYGPFGSSHVREIVERLGVPLR